jgi:hypothetical protein
MITAITSLPPTHSPIPLPLFTCSRTSRPTVPRRRHARANGSGKAPTLHCGHSRTHTHTRPIWGRSRERKEIGQRLCSARRGMHATLKCADRVLRPSLLSVHCWCPGLHLNGCRNCEHKKTITQNGKNAPLLSCLAARRQNLMQRASHSPGSSRTAFNTGYRIAPSAHKNVLACIPFAIASTR